MHFRLILLLVFLLEVFNDFYVQSTTSFSVADTIITLIGWMLLWCSHAFLASARNNCDCICSYINGLNTVKLITRKLVSKRHQKIRITIVASICMFATYCLYVTAVTLPVIYVYGLHIIDPCKPSLVAHFLLQGCAVHDNQVDWMSYIFNQVVKFAILLLNHWIWAFGFNIIPLTCANILILCTITCTHYLKW